MITGTPSPSGNSLRFHYGTATALLDLIDGGIDPLKKFIDVRLLPRAAAQRTDAQGTKTRRPRQRLVQHLGFGAAPAGLGLGMFQVPSEQGQMDPVIVDVNDNRCREVLGQTLMLILDLPPHVLPWPVTDRYTKDDTLNRRDQQKTSQQEPIGRLGQQLDEMQPFHVLLF